MLLLLRILLIRRGVAVATTHVLDGLVSYDKLFLITDVDARVVSIREL